MAQKKKKKKKKKKNGKTITLYFLTNSKPLKIWYSMLKKKTAFDLSRSSRSLFLKDYLPSSISVSWNKPYHSNPNKLYKTHPLVNDIIKIHSSRKIEPKLL